MERRTIRGSAVAVLVVLALVLVFVMGAKLFTRGGRVTTTHATAPVPAPLAEAEEELRAESAPESRSERSPEQPLAAETETDAPSASRVNAVARVVVHARLVDELRTPLAGGRLSVRLPDGETSATGAEDGEIVLVVERERLHRARGSFQASAPGRATRSVRFEEQLLGSGAEAYLGEIVLAAGATLVGRVIDESGTPTGARVVACPPGNEGELGAGARVWLPIGSFPDGSRFAGISGDEGFRLEGVPAGPVQLFASDTVRLVARSETIELGAGEERRVNDLVLREPQEGDRIAGVVRAADGAPFAGAMVRLLDESEQAILGWVFCDGAGRFAVLALRDRTYTLTAHSPANATPARAKGVHAGDLALELRFGAHGSLEVTARDERGPVVSFRVVVEDAEQCALSWCASDAAGRARVDVPGESFRVVVNGPEHRPLQLGPFEPSTAPAQLEAELVRAGGIAGVVLADGAPLAYAEVHAHAAVDGADLGWLPEGFVSRVEPRLLARTRADADGRFFVALRTGGRVRLHASAPGRARASSDWFDVRDGQRVEGCELRLPLPGAIEGRVRVSPGVEARGRWVGAGDGEGHVELVQTDASGAFLFPSLAPGTWQVRRVRAGEQRALAGEPGCFVRESEPTPFDLVVRAGETTRADLDLTDEIPCTLEGRLLLGGAAPRGWTVELGRSETQPLDAEGRFTARAETAGKLWLGLHGAGSSLSAPIELRPGPNVWELDLPVGEVRFENLPAAPEGDADAREPMLFRLEWRTDEGTWQADVRADSAACARLERVPAGHLAMLVHRRPEGEWSALVELDLAAGEVRTVRLP